jgi:hypothetical protein
MDTVFRLDNKLWALDLLEKQSRDSLEKLQKEVSNTEDTFFTPEQIAKMNTFYKALPPYLRNDFANWVKEISQTDNN